MDESGTDLLLTKAIARICPVCLEQVDPDDDHWHYGTNVEPLEVEAYPFLDQLRAKRALALFRLQTDRREHEFAEAERRWYDNLSVADRFWEDSRRKRVRREKAEARRLERAKLPPGLARMDEILRETWAETIEGSFDFGRQLFADWIAYPTADALDDWFAKDGPIPEVTAALGFE